MTLFHYWQTVNSTQNGSGVKLPNNPSGGVDLCTISAQRREDDTIMRVLSSCVMGFRCKGSGHQPPWGWWDFTDVTHAVGFRPSADGVFPDPEQADQFGLLAVTDLHVKAVVDPANANLHSVRWETTTEVDSHGQRRGSGNPGAFPTVYSSLQLFSEDLIGVSAGNSTGIDWFISSTMRVLIGSTSP